jgi:hypothetical protein
VRRNLARNNARAGVEIADIPDVRLEANIGSENGR